MALQQIDVDELAREKVQEIENLLNSAEGLKLDLVNSWLCVLKGIITAADLHRTSDKNDNFKLDNSKKTEIEESIYADFSDDNEQFNAIDLTEQFASNSVKRTIRVQAFKIVHRLVQIFSKNYSATSKTILLKHLSDLVRLSFVAATSPFDDLKLQGFEMFKFLINRFSAVEEKEFPGHSILEQYRTQVITALKPAFNLDAPPYITAIASQICSLWITKGLEKDIVNLERAYHLMVLTITKLEQQSTNQNSALYTESELEQERLDILGSWAQLYIISMEYDDMYFDKNTVGKTIDVIRFEQSALKKLVRQDTGSLIGKWWDALKDYALLIMPSSKMTSVSHDNEHVYTRDVALRLFEPVWFKLVLASTLWLCFDLSPNNHLQSTEFSKTKELPSSQETTESEPNLKFTYLCGTVNTTSRSKYFKFICGILMKELCRCQSEAEAQKEYLAESTIYALRSLSLSLKNTELSCIFMDDPAIPLEFYTILYSILIRNRKLRSQYSLFLRHLLELIFNVVFSKVHENQINVKYGLAYLIEFFKRSIAVIDSATTATESEKSAAHTDMLVSVNTFIHMLKSNPDQIHDNTPLGESIIGICRQILSDIANISIGTYMIERIRLNSTDPSHSLCILLEHLYDVQVYVVSNLLQTKIVSETEKQDSPDSFTADADSFRRSILFTISLTDDKNRKRYIDLYLESLFRTLSRFKATSKSSHSIKKNRALVLKWINELSEIYPDVFEQTLSSDQKQMLKEANKIEQAKNEVKQDAQTSKKSTLISSQAKITLKADFSNFYVKKS